MVLIEAARRSRAIGNVGGDGEPVAEEHQGSSAEGVMAKKRVGICRKGGKAGEARDRGEVWKGWTSRGAAYSCGRRI